LAQSNTPAEIPAEVQEAAAYWSVRLANEPSEADLAVFEAWIAENPLHLQVFNQAEDTLSLIGEHSAGPELLAMRRDALERARQSQRRRWLGGVSLDRRQLAVAAAGLVAVPAGAAWWMMRRPAGERLSTGVGEQRTVTLSDGTRVTMDAMSEVRVDYSRDLRLLELTSGRAFFAVAKDINRPLRVRAGSRAVTALGTAFSVEREIAGMLVTLVEGRVAVSDPRANAPIEMTPHQALRLSDAAAPSLTSNIDSGRALAWRDGQVVFDDVDLATAVARMNTYSHVPIVLDEAGRAKLGALRLSGVFTAGDSVSFAEAMQAYFNLSVSRSNKAITLKAASARS
jgi:transmembrane sensor